jgi:hypothetical protein
MLQTLFSLIAAGDGTGGFPHDIRASPPAIAAVALRSGCGLNHSIADRKIPETTPGGVRVVSRGTIDRGLVAQYKYLFVAGGFANNRC